MISSFKNLRFNNSRKFSRQNFSELITRAKVTIKKNSELWSLMSEKLVLLEKLLTRKDLYQQNINWERTFEKFYIVKSTELSKES